MYNQAKSQMHNKITPIFLIGAMKSGTTTISKHLEIQKEICFGPRKEIEFFSLRMGNLEYKKSNFWELYDLKSHHKFVFDGSTGYTKYPAEKGVPKRIFDHGLKPKFIYIVRNPLERIESHYNYMLKDLNWNGYITSKHLIHTSNYYLQLKQYEPFFLKKDILIIDFEELKNNHKICMQKIYDHIGLKDYCIGDVVQSNMTKPVNRKQIEIKKKLEGKFTFLPQPIKQAGKKVLSNLFAKKKKKLKSKERKLIQSQLQDDMKKFKTEYGFPVEKWGF